MVCKQCGNALAEGSTFCRFCGARVENPDSTAASPAGFFSAPGDLRGSAPKRTPGASAEADTGSRVSSGVRFASSLSSDGARGTNASASSDADFEGVSAEPDTDAFASKTVHCPHCGAEMRPDDRFCAICGGSIGPAARKSAPKRPHSAKKKKLLISGIALITVCVLVFGIVGIVALVRANGPFGQILSSLENTLTDKSFSVRVSLYEDGSLEDKYTAEVVFSPADRELTAVISDGRHTYAIYQGYIIYKNSDYVYKEDISDEVEMFFDVYNSVDLSEPDPLEALDRLEPSGRALREIEEYVDTDALSKCFGTLLEQLNDEKWLKENAGYSSSERSGSTTVCFDLDYDVLPQFLYAVLETMKPAFRSIDDYYDLKDSVAYLQRRENTSVYLEFTTEGKYLTSAVITAQEHYDSLRITLDFSDIGSTEIDVEELDYWLRIAES